MTVSSEWNEGYTVQVRIRNTGTAPIHGWQVGWSFGDGSRVSNHWNAELSGGNPYSAAPVSWNRTIQPGQQAEFGFNVNKGRPGAPAVPVAITGGSAIELGMKSGAARWPIGGHRHADETDREGVCQRAPSRAESLAGDSHRGHTEGAVVADGALSVVTRDRLR